MYDAELIDINGVYFGEIILTLEYFFFVSFGLVTPESETFRSNKVDMAKKKK